MQIKALQSIVIRNTETGDLTSIAYGTVADVPDEIGQSLIADGIAERYEGGGGSQVVTLWSGTFAASDGEDGIYFYGTESDNNIPNTITVRYDGQTYEMVGQSFHGGLMFGEIDADTQMPVFSTYPFAVMVVDGTQMSIAVPDTNEHTMEIAGELTPVYPTGTFPITNNGEYDVREFAAVDVNVSAQIYGKIDIYENGTYDVKDKAEAYVSVPFSPVFAELTIVNNTGKQITVGNCGGGLNNKILATDRFIDNGKSVKILTPVTNSGYIKTALWVDFGSGSNTVQLSVSGDIYRMFCTETVAVSSTRMALIFVQTNTVSTEQVLTIGVAQTTE